MGRRGGVVAVGLRCGLQAVAILTMALPTVGIYLLWLYWLYRERRRRCRGRLTVSLLTKAVWLCLLWAYLLWLYYLRQVTLRDISYACMQASSDSAHGARVQSAWLLVDIRRKN